MGCQMLQRYGTTDNPWLWRATLMALDMWWIIIVERITKCWESRTSIRRRSRHPASWRCLEWSNKTLLTNSNINLWWGIIEPLSTIAYVGVSTLGKLGNEGQRKMGINIIFRVAIHRNLNNMSKIHHIQNNRNPFNHSTNNTCFQIKSKSRLPHLWTTMILAQQASSPIIEILAHS